MANKYMRRCSTSSFLKEMQNKAIMNCTSIKMVEGREGTKEGEGRKEGRKERRKKRARGEGGRKGGERNGERKTTKEFRITGTFTHCWLEHKIIKSLWKSVWQFLPRLNIDLPSNPAIPLLGNYTSKR